MESFLSKVVADILKKYANLDNFVFVLPNQRAGVYLKKHLRKGLNKSVFFPEVITFDNLSEQLTGVFKTSSIELLFDFYTIYKENTPKESTDSFEQFSNWAITVLNDFNEIDRNLVEPKNIFNTLKTVNELNNWNPNTELTQNYLAFFKNLEQYYQIFYEFLITNQKGYQGLLLKESVAGLQHFIANSNKQFVFIGFNYLKKGESYIIEELLASNKAAIYWDIPYGLLDKNNKAGAFIRQYFSNWSYYKNQSFTPEIASKLDPDKIEIIGVSKNVGMLKYANELLEKSIDNNQTALVLADQNDLSIALNSIPKNIEKINITMGFPLKHLPFSDLVKSIFELHIREVSPNNKQGFYYKSVLRISQHPLIQKHIKGVAELTHDLISKNKVYINFGTIKKHVDLSNQSNKILLNLFQINTDKPIQSILLKINKLITYLKNEVNDYEREALYRHYQLNQQLQRLTTKYQYLTSVKALYKVYTKLLHAVNINFIGEPLQGIQIMGFLETQTLDFKQLIITSVNEGVLPKGKRTNSFIPFDVRKHYNLPTYEEEDADATYHFYRLLQRADQVNLLYNAQTDSFGGGEKSHLLTQLLWQYPNISQKIINPKVPSDSLSLESVEKTPEVIKKLEELAYKGFSPSSLSTYLYNPKEFYQQKVLKIEEVSEVEETVADNTMGTVIHETLEKLYKPIGGAILDVNSLVKLLSKVPQQVKVEFKNAYKNGQYDQGKNKLIYEVIVNFVNRFIKDEIKQVKEGRIIRILDLELPLSHEIRFSKFDFPIKFTGKVDRIDEVDGVIRIVDYKSGKVEKSQLHLNDFSKILGDYKYSKALQVMLYAYMYSKHKNCDSTKELQAGIVSFKNLKSGFIPVNFASGRQTDNQITTTHFEGFLKVLEDLLLEIFDTTISFTESE